MVPDAAPPVLRPFSKYSRRKSGRTSRRPSTTYADVIQALLSPSTMRKYVQRAESGRVMRPGFATDRCVMLVLRSRGRRLSEYSHDYHGLSDGKHRRSHTGSAILERLLCRPEWVPRGFQNTQATVMYVEVIQASPWSISVGLQCSCNFGDGLSL
jgi:hypothetical protein